MKRKTIKIPVQRLKLSFKRKMNSRTEGLNIWQQFLLTQYEKWYCLVEVEKPHDHLIWVYIIAHIKNNETSEVRQYKEKLNIEFGESHPNDYIWESGNYACDCNREIFFRKAGQEEKIDHDCGDGKYSVNLQNPRTGDMFYSEF